MYEVYEQLLKELGLTTYKVAKDTGIAQSVFSAWKNGVSQPKPDKLKKIADRLHVSVDYLMSGEAKEEKKWYLDDETARIAQKVFENPDLRMLLDAADDSRSEDIQMAADMLRRFKETNPDG